MAFRSHHKVRFDDVDGAGIVYYPHFLHLCHAAFEDWFEQSGMPVSYPELIRERREGFPTVAIQAEFFAPLLYGDTALVDFSVTRMGRSSMSCRYEMTRERDGTKSFVANITQVLMDLDTQRSIPLPDEYRAALETVFKPDAVPSEG